MYLPVVTLSTENYNKLSEKLKTGFKITVKWKKYSSEISNQIIILFTKVNRLFALSFKNEEDRTYFGKYYTPTVEIKDFNVLIYAFLTHL